MQPDDVIGGHQAGENSLQSQCDPSPRRVEANTGSEEPGTPPRSPAIGMGSGTEISRFVPSTEEEGLFHLKTSMDGLLRPNCTSTEQEYILLLQPDIRIDENNETTTQQAAAQEEFARPTKKRHQQGMAAWSTDHNRQFDRVRSRVNSLLF